MNCPCKVLPLTLVEGSVQQMRNLLGLVIMLCLLLVIGGCNKAPVRQAVYGTVRFEGKPIDQGQIQFTPVKGGPSAGTDILQGQYKLEGPRGPGLGQYKVEITAYRAGQPGQYDAATKQREVALIQYVPSKYNENSELLREITEAEESMRMDFELTKK
jgi:hypothetical protein